MFSSQESDTDCFSQPGHSQGFLVGHALQRHAIQSPTKTKKRSRLFTTVCGNSKGMEGNMDYADGMENEAPSHFNVMFSQDSNMCSQMSEDFSHRFKSFNVKSSQDDYSNLEDDTRSMMSTDGFCLHQQHLNGRNHMAPYSVMKSRTNNNSSSGIASSSKKNHNNIPIAGMNGEEKQKQITIAPPIDNPFILHPQQYHQQQSRKPPAPTSLWIAPYKERPRYVTDFEHVKDIGMGTFSSIFLARRRLDGMLYAIKRIVKTIMSDKEGKLVIREACAHAALVGCPHMIQYFGCWLDDGHLHIQTEYCNLGSLEIFTKKTPSKNNHTITEIHSHAHMDDPQSNYNHPLSHSQMESQLTDSQDPDSLHHSEDSALMLGDNDDLDGCLDEEDHDELAHSEVDPPRKLLRLHTSEVHEHPFDSNTVLPDFALQGQGSDVAQGQGLGSTINTSISLAFNDTLAWLVLARIGEALTYMHSRGMVHLDLRPANIFLTNTQGQGLGSGYGPPGQSDCLPSDIPLGLMEGRIVMKLGDLGHTVTYQRTITPSSTRDMEEVPGFGKATEPGPEQEWTEGESRYCARELIVHNNDFSSGLNPLDLRAADMFSLGATVYELCLGRELGSSSSSSNGGRSTSQVNYSDRSMDDGLVEWHGIRDGHLDQVHFVSKYSAEIVQIIRDLMDANPMRRPTAAALTQVAKAQLAVLQPSL